MKATQHDDGLAWLHEIRARLARKFDYDPRQAANHYRRIEKESGAKIYRPEVPAGAGLHAPAVLHDRARATATASPSAAPTSYRAARKRKAKPAQ